MSKNKIIVFGGTGYYGRHIVRSLIRNGEAVKVLSRDKTKAKKIAFTQSKAFLKTRQNGIKQKT